MQSIQTTSLTENKIILPGSKSMTHQALLLATLSQGVSELACLELSNETRALIHALKQLGIVVQLDENHHSCIIAGAGLKLPKNQASLWCEHLNILYILTTLCAASSGVYYLDGNHMTRQYSLKFILNLLCQQGAQCLPSESVHLPFTLIGTDSLQGGKIIIDQEISPEFIATLFMIAPFARSAFTFIFPDLKHATVMDSVCALMADFGVLVNRIHSGQFAIPVPQYYQARDYEIEPDPELIPYFFSAAALTETELRTQTLTKPLSLATEKKFIFCLEKMGCYIEQTLKEFIIHGPKEMLGIEINLPSFSNIFICLTILSGFAKTPTYISFPSLSPEDEQALTHFKTMLGKLNFNIESGENWLHIYPSHPQKNIVEVKGDIRLGKAIALLNLKIPNIIIKDMASIEIAFKDFLTIWQTLPIANKKNNE